jgi:hypothetical protein
MPGYNGVKLRSNVPVLLLVMRRLLPSGNPMTNSCKTRLNESYIVARVRFVC